MTCQLGKCRRNSQTSVCWGVLCFVMRCWKRVCLGAFRWGRPWPQRRGSVFEWCRCGFRTRELRWERLMRLMPACSHNSLLLSQRHTVHKSVLNLSLHSFNKCLKGGKKSQGVANLARSCIKCLRSPLFWSLSGGNLWYLTMKCAQMEIRRSSLEGEWRGAPFLN